MLAEGWLAERLLILVPLWLSLTVHEWAHAWTAFQLGDTFAAREGRMTLDPFAHVDPVGTFFLPLLGVPFGWAKPVPLSLAFRPGVRTETGLLLVAIAGPISNLVLVAVVVTVAALLHAAGLLADGPRRLVELLVTLNLALAAFNLLPIPPLDGSRIVDALVPERYREVWGRIGFAGPVVLVVALGVLLPLVFDLHPFAGLQALAGRLLPPR